MERIKTILDSIALIFTIIIVLYGMTKGYDLIDLSLNFMYFIVILITQIIHLLERIGR